MPSESGEPWSAPPGDACRQSDPFVSIRMRIGLPCAGTMGGTLDSGEASPGRERFDEGRSDARSPLVTLK